MLRPSRREFLKQTGTLTALSAVAGSALPAVHAGEDNTIRMAIIGCGPRGSGAVGNALSAPGGPLKLIAMADVFEDKLQRSHKALRKEFGDKIDVPADRQFIGFDAYRKAIDCLKPGDIALLTTRAAFRPMHFEYAVAKGVNVFMEKSFAPDPAGIKRLLKNNEIAEKKKLKVSCGLQCRHSSARQALVAKIREGAMGEILFIRAYRMQSGGRIPPQKPDPKELLKQLRYSSSFLWYGAGNWLDNMIHQVDECCWLKDAFPISAHGMGGRSPHSTDCSQNLENYTIEYTFADGAKALVQGRFTPKCYNEFATYVHGTKCGGKFSGNIHAPDSWTYKDQRALADNIAWRPTPETVNPWQAEWNDFLAALRKDQPYNELKRSALSNLVGIMGRAAAHTGNVITWDEMLASDFSFCPNIDSLNENSPAPVMPDKDGRYPAPIPGQWKEI
jgi:predicted dehydrogenase